MPLLRYLKHVKIAIAARLWLVAVIGLTMLGTLPAPAQADEDLDLINLELGGEGSTSWSISNILPCASGTKTITLHNAGSDDGFIAIWISDLSSGEGLNPESETDTTGEGELDDYLLFDLTTAPSGRLTSSMSLPTTINDFPTSVSGPGYIRINPLSSGETITLYWNWELPCVTGNDVQGDTISFTINFYLEGPGLGSIGDLVWADTDGDGYKDSGEDGIANITVSLLNFSDKSLLATTETDANGYYLFSELEAGDYIVDVDDNDSDMPAGYFSTTHNDPMNVTLATSEDYLAADFGYGPEADGIIGDLVWDDANGNGVYDEGEVGIPFVTLNLFDASEVWLAETESDYYGNYFFFHNPVGTYYVEVDLTDPQLDGYTPTTPTLVEAIIASNFLDADFGFTTTTTPPPSTPPGGGGSDAGPETCHLIIDMLGERTTVEMDCCRNTTLEECNARDPDEVHLLELEMDTLVRCGECDGCYCYPRIIVMSLSEESISPPEGFTIVGPIYDFTGYKDLRLQIPCHLVTYFNPVASVLLHYDPDLLPLGASNPVIAFFSHADNQWVVLPPDTGRVAEVGIATGLAEYFASPFAVLASVPADTSEPPATPEPAHFVASGLNITPSEVKVEESVNISLNVTNDGEETGSYTVELKINGQTVDSQVVTLTGGQSELVSFTVTETEAGEYEVSVSGLNGSFTVVKPFPWWIFIIIAAVIIAGILCWRYRKQLKKKLGFLWFFKKSGAKPS